MCGFVAVYNKEEVKGQSHASLTAMCDLMSHRGPDHVGHFGDRHVLLGHQRLSIIDLSDQANQPLHIARYVIVYNGEIYNYIEIRDEISRQSSLPFTTNSDTEVILRAYMQFGPECVRLFNGMFAFVIWDRVARRLFAATDRLGVKPLYLTTDAHDNYCFASDPKALWEFADVGTDLNAEFIYTYLTHGYLSGLETSRLPIRKFPPAHYLTLSETDERYVRYWDLSNVSKAPVSFDDAVSETERLLKNAVSIRLRSDVPVGSFLSGGVDSSLISAIATKEYGQPLHSFSIGVDPSEYDESRFGRRIAEHCNTHHHHQSLNSDCLQELPEIVWKYSEIIGDSSVAPCYSVAQQASSKLRVVLTGDGGMNRSVAILSRTPST